MAATLGAVYGLILLPAPGTALGISAAGVAWFFLSLGLLFVVPVAYHAYTLWTILWIVWRGVTWFREPFGWSIVLDVGIPLASLALLMSSSYMALAQPPEEGDDEATRE